MRLDEIFLDLAKEPAAARNYLGGARTDQPHLQHVGLDDGANVHPVALRHIGMRNAPAAVLALANPGKAVIGLERIAAGGDEIDHRVELGAAERGVGRRRSHLGIKRVAVKRLAAGAAEDVLRENIEAAGARRRRILGIDGNGVERGAAFQHFETVCGNEHALGRFVHAVIGAADPLQQPRRALRRADINDKIDVAPVDAEIERGGAHHRAQPAGRHRGLDLAPLRHVERAVVQRDREVVVVQLPEVLENALGLAAGVDEYQSRAVRP